MKVPTRLAVIVSVAALVGALVSAPQVAAKATSAVPAATLTGGQRSWDVTDVGHGR